ncbi:MAG: class I SAM-dependent methyltransferase family protein [Nitrososphaerales archaeon]
MVKLLRDSLGGLLPPGQARALETGIDIIGDIAIVKLSEEARPSGPVVGDAIMASMKNVKAVFDQEGGLEGDFRLRRLRHVAGEDRTLTLHKENLLRFMVDVEKCYFSPRLSTERARIADLVEDGEVVLNMFAGVGPYSITIAKRKRAEVYSNELNETAYRLHLENNKLNKVEARVKMLNLDAAVLPDHLKARFDRILMPHPSQSDRFLETARGLLKEGGWIHYYRHVSGADAGEARANLNLELRRILGDGASFTSRKVREIGPHYIELVADIQARA